MPRTSTDSPEIFQNHLLNPNFTESQQLDDADIFQSEDALSQDVYISPQVPKKSSQFGKAPPTIQDIEISTERDDGS
jgi:hypothetical protein